MRVLIWTIVILVVVIIITIIFLNFEKDLEQEYVDSVGTRIVQITSLDSSNLPGIPDLYTDQYIVDMKLAPTIELVKKRKYEFVINSAHPFYFSDSPVGNLDASNNLIPDMIPVSNGKIIFQIPDHFPTSFYYTSTNKNVRGGKIVII